MGMGYVACSEWVISNEKVKEIVSNEYDKFIKVLLNNDISIEEFAMEAQFIDEIIAGLKDLKKALPDDVVWDDFCSEAGLAYEELIKAFKDKTDIRIYLKYHDQEVDGDRYDEVDGAFFVLDWNDMYQLTPEAKALIGNDVSDDIIVSHWVYFN